MNDKRVPLDDTRMREHMRLWLQILHLGMLQAGGPICNVIALSHCNALQQQAPCPSLTSADDAKECEHEPPGELPQVPALDPPVVLDVFRALDVPGKTRASRTQRLMQGHFCLKEHPGSDAAEPEKANFAGRLTRTRTPLPGARR